MGNKKSSVLDVLCDKYQVIQWDSYYLIYDKELKGTYTQMKYYGYTTKLGNKLIFNKKEYNNVDTLITDMLEYAKNLEYPIDFDCPSYNMRYRNQMKLHSYITSLGFEKSDWNSMFGYEYTFYSLKDIYGKEICKFFVANKYEDDTDEFKGKICQSLEGYSMISSKFNNLKEAKQAVNTLIAPNALYIAQSMVSASEKSTNVINFDNLNKNIVTNQLSSITIPMKSLIKDKLTELLNQLD